MRRRLQDALLGRLGTAEFRGQSAFAQHQDPVGQRQADLPAELKPVPAARASALVKLCLAVFNLNEFIHVD